MLNLLKQFIKHPNFKLGVTDFNRLVNETIKLINKIEEK
jgi:hypothetical protein